jgi:SAM-dependent methyltransferase
MRSGATTWTLFDVTESEIRRVQAFYDELAPSFDRIHADWNATVRRQGEALQRLLDSRLGAERQHRVLDCTCGIGTQALGLLGRGHVVVGSDLSTVAVQRAAHESLALGFDARFITADMRRLPFRTAAFDAVISADNSLPHLLTETALRSALLEMARVTRPGGALLVNIRDYDEALVARPASRPPSVSGEIGNRVVTFQLWHWHDDNEHYDVELFQLSEHAADWTVSRWRMPSWALSRTTVEEAAEIAGWRDMTWHEPTGGGFFHPVLLATKR